MNQPHPIAGPASSGSFPRVYRRIGPIGWTVIAVITILNIIAISYCIYKIVDAYQRAEDLINFQYRYTPLAISLGLNAIKIEIRVYCCIIVFGAIVPLLGAFVSMAKRRNIAEGYSLASIFSFFGVLIAALMPTNPLPTPEQEAAEEAARISRAQAQSAAAARQVQARQAQRQQAAAARAQWNWDRGITPGPFAWVHLFPDWGQAIAIGLIVSVFILAFVYLYFNMEGR